MSGDGAAGVEIAVGIGSNVGDREECLRYAVRQLERRLERLRPSAVYRSLPREGARGGEYLNMCVVGVWRARGRSRAERSRGSRPGRTENEPGGSAGRLLDELRFVEIGAGRRLQRKPGEPRPLDLDLLLFGDRRIREPELTVPHPRMAERAFVLRPLSEIAPEWRHPGRDETVAELAGRRSDPGVEPYGHLHEIT